jgi:dGTPase
MNWESLLSTKRYNQQIPQQTGIDRSAFEKDFDRIVFSTAFRKLQDKTQVIPFPITDFVHSRLTHSLEVSCVGRSLGKMVGQRIMDTNPELLKLGYDASAIGSLVASSSLAHDIGNPAFGHSGENAFRSFFLGKKGCQFENQLSKNQWQDFIRYEGNANGFRILTNLNQAGGLRLTAATLAAFTKYPTNAIPTENPLPHHKKFGYFDAEKEVFQNIASETKLLKTDHGYSRHPLAYLMEAADDICYSIIDFEDGLRLGLIDMNTAYELFKQLIGEQLNLTKLKKLHSKEEQAGLMRALAINKLTTEAAEIFLDNELSILQGTYHNSIIKSSTSIQIIKDIKKISIDKVYQSDKVVMIEAAGFEVIEGLLEIFIDATLSEKGNMRANKMLQLIPTQYLNDDGGPHADLYTNLLSVCDFVSGMSDSQAITLFRKLKGIEIPH